MAYSPSYTPYADAALARGGVDVAFNCEGGEAMAISFQKGLTSWMGKNAGYARLSTKRRGSTVTITHSDTLHSHITLTASATGEQLSLTEFLPDLTLVQDEAEIAAYTAGVELDDL